MKLEEMLLTESIERDTMKYYWALQQLQYKPEIDHIRMILETSRKESVDGDLMIALVAAESSFIANQQHYNSGSNDYGLFQLNNLWHNQHRGDVKGHIEEGIKHFKWCLKTEHNNVTNALSRYNTGAGSGAAGRIYASYVMRKKRPIDAKVREYDRKHSSRGSIASRGRPIKRDERLRGM